MVLCVALPGLTHAVVCTGLQPLWLSAVPLSVAAMFVEAFVRAQLGLRECPALDNPVWVWFRF